MSLCYPEWYKIEKESATIINGLSNFTDLNFYLTNSNQYIRRQALLRVNELKPVESLNILEEILNNPLESNENKKLAGWALKAISNEHKLDFYISDPLREKYIDHELDIGIKHIKILEPYTSKGLSITPPPLYSELDIDEDYLVRNNEVDFQITLDLKEWFQAWKGHFFSNSINAVKNFPKLLLAGLIKIVKLIYIKFLSKLLRSIKDRLINLYYRKKHEIQPLKLLQSFCFLILCGLLAPFRFIRRNKKIIFSGLLLVAIYLGYRSYGYENVLNYLDIESNQTLSKLFFTGKSIFHTVWTEAGNVSNVLIKKITTNEIWKNIRQYMFFIN
ncbi:MAG: hypothetical protein ACOYJ1_01865 [Peptococcales bacterium]|jgi:hypothetical protein